MALYIGNWGDFTLLIGAPCHSIYNDRRGPTLIFIEWTQLRRLLGKSCWVKQDDASLEKK